MSTSVWRGYPSKTYPYGPGAFAIFSGKGPDKTCNYFERIFRDIKCIYMLVEFYNPTFSISPTHFNGVKNYLNVYCLQQITCFCPTLFEIIYTLAFISKLC